MPVADLATMRCYFLRDDKIQNVELLRDGSDEDLIEQARRLFQEHNGDQKYDGFEVWSGSRFVHRESMGPPLHGSTREPTSGKRVRRQKWVMLLETLASFKAVPLASFPHEVLYLVSRSRDQADAGGRLHLLRGCLPVSRLA
ncbi:hypothetical protein [Reyranella soli]|uniref:Uncharacterized protein n=1 Tax=Reyranella soli TaxID=1230389 RepID=A0A512NTA0_9HYPH|nr:hypothetical protein [Reyranella soli]GEP62185.1 hypothetical protein RSO01_93510 [Reyranella soli]